jgi:hypothetical protein
LHMIDIAMLTFLRSGSKSCYFCHMYWKLSMLAQHWTLNTEHWSLNTEHWSLNTEHWSLNSKSWMLNAEYRLLKLNTDRRPLIIDQWPLTSEHWKTYTIILPRTAPLWELINCFTFLCNSIVRNTAGKHYQWVNSASECMVMKLMNWPRERCLGWQNSFNKTSIQ